MLRGSLASTLACLHSSVVSNVAAATLEKYVCFMNQINSGLPLIGPIMQASVLVAWVEVPRRLQMPQAPEGEPMSADTR